MFLLPIAMLTLAGSARGQPPPPPRVEVPIEAVRLSDGTVRYGVRIEVGGKPALAGLDTGAAGVRLLPDAADGARIEAGTAAESYAFGSGAHLTGVTGRTRIAIGALSGAASVHLVRAVDCMPGRPGCPGRLGLGYGFLGNGLPGEGFRALLGGNMGPTTIDTPMTAVGARRWIVELPRPGEAGPGRLVLNPSEAEIAGFTMVKLVGGFAERDGGGMHDAVPACLRHRTNGQRICGPAAMDTGAFFMRVLNAPATAPRWPNGEPLALDFLGPERQTQASARITAGAAAQQLAYGTAPRRETMLQLGVGPYYAYAVLYDPAGRRLGFKARPPVEGLPVAE